MSSPPHLVAYRLSPAAGDVWFPQPAPKDHPWRTAPNIAMTPHMSGASLSAQMRHAAGTRDILVRAFVLFFQRSVMKSVDLAIGIEWVGS